MTFRSPKLLLALFKGHKRVHSLRIYTAINYLSYHIFVIQVYEEISLFFITEQMVYYNVYGMV